MSTNYIEIDSTYRDRTMYPLPSDFVVQVSQSGRKGINDSLDPVSLSAPINVWTSNAFANAAATATLTATVQTITVGFGGGGDNTYVVEITAVGGTMQTADNYYLNCVAKDTTGTVGASRIIEYKYLGKTGGGLDRGQIKLTGITSVAAGDTILIQDPTDFSDVSFPLVFVPDGRIGNNSYYGYLLYNETLQQWRTIIDYDFDTHILNLNTAVEGSVVGWLATHNYSIRKQVPLFRTNVVAATTSTVTTGTGSTVNNFYKGMFLRVLGTLYGTTPVPSTSNEMRRIVAYNGTTKTFSVMPAFSGIPAGNVEILDFSYDNANPIIYNINNNNQATCYEIELLNLCLPNITLASAEGRRIAFYSYVYVELTNVSNPNSGNIHPLWSNNPNSTKMVFRASIDDINNPVVSSFVKVDGDGTIQKIKFKLNDSLRFSVKLPNGDYFQTQQEDNFGPLSPDPNLQISALFQVRGAY